jgi:hypothetical protein
MNISNLQLSNSLLRLLCDLDTYAGSVAGDVTPHLDTSHSPTSVASAHGGGTCHTIASAPGDWYLAQCLMTFYMQRKGPATSYRHSNLFGMTSTISGCDGGVRWTPPHLFTRWLAFTFPLARGRDSGTQLTVLRNRPHQIPSNSRGGHREGHNGATKNARCRTFPAKCACSARPISTPSSP